MISPIVFDDICEALLFVAAYQTSALIEKHTGDSLDDDGRTQFPKCLLQA